MVEQAEVLICKLYSSPINTGFMRNIQILILGGLKRFVNVMYSKECECIFLSLCCVF